VLTPWLCATATTMPQPPPRSPAHVTRPGAAAATGVPIAAAKSTPVWKRSPRGPKTSVYGVCSGARSGIGQVGAGLRSAASTAGPATPSTGRYAQASNFFRARTLRLPKVPSIVADGKPCQASMNCTAAASQPTVPSVIVRLPSV
jgi:hypothetical protein